MSRDMSEMKASRRNFRRVLLCGRGCAGRGVYKKMFPQTLAMSHNKQTSKLATTNIPKAEGAKNNTEINTGSRLSHNQFSLQGATVTERVLLRIL